jgi:sulfate transport system ATP-binding protein
MSISIRNVSKSFGTKSVLKDVSLEVPSGGLMALLGPSGSGKTTLLRMIAGLDTPDSGTIAFHGEDATERRVRDRDVGYVFQHYALFRHMTVFENVAFGLRVRPRKTRPSENEIRDKVHALLKLVQLDWLGDSYPSQLSGGQRQRIALARTLAVNPEVLLLDEPFGALDAKVRKDLRRWLRRLHDELHVTSVLVTHDQEEALEVADQVVVMNEGRIEQHGTPDEVWEQPATPFVFSFLGNVNLFHGRMNAGKIRIDTGELLAPEWAGAGERNAMAFVRSHDIDIGGAGRSDPSAAQAVVRHVRRLGHIVRLELDHVETGQIIEAELSRARFGELGLQKGDTVYVTPQRAKVFLKDG